MFKFRPYLRFSKKEDRPAKQSFRPFKTVGMVTTSWYPMSKRGFTSLIDKFQLLTYLYEDHPELIPKQLNPEKEKQFTKPQRNRRRRLLNRLTDP